MTPSAALVTGAGRGIGRAIALRLLAQGRRVACLDLDEGTLFDLPDGALPIAADIRDEEALREAFAMAMAQFGRIGAVFANAATEPLDRDALPHLLEAATFRDIVDTNLTGAFLTCKHGLRSLLDSGGGSIVLTASPTGSYGIAPAETGYSSSKGGVVSLMRVIAAGYAGQGIRANCVLPGVTDTRVNQPFLADSRLREEMLSAIPMRRVATADEVAAVAAFLASDEASYVTGAIYTVDGGLTAI